MPNQPPLNPDGVTAAQDALWNSGIGAQLRLMNEDCKIMSEIVLRAYFAVAQPEVNSVESLPAQMRMLMWEGGEFEVGEIPDGHVLVGFEMETDRAWSMADKVTVNIERPEVES